MSDVWEDEDQQDIESRQLNGEWNARRAQFYNEGYREGVETGRGQTLQEGFDKGYTQGLNAGLAWGTAQGGLRMLRECKNKGLISQECQIDQAQQYKLLSTSDQRAHNVMCRHILKESGIPSGLSETRGEDFDEQAAQLLAAQAATLSVLDKLKETKANSSQ